MPRPPMTGPGDGSVGRRWWLRLEGLIPPPVGALAGRPGVGPTAGGGVVGGRANDAARSALPSRVFAKCRGFCTGARRLSLVPAGVYLRYRHFVQPSIWLESWALRLCVPNIRFGNIDGEGRRETVLM